MNPSDLIREGNLQAARAELIETIKSKPADTRSRTLLFQVLACLGEWDKAERHLETLTLQSPQSATGMLLYRNLVGSEKIRSGVLRGERTPDFMVDPPSFLQDFLAARQAFASGDAEKATNLLEKIEEAAPNVSGIADGIPFDGIMDSDTTLFCVLEAFIHDRYLWFPFTGIRELTIQEPTSLLDTIWVPGRIVTWEGLTTDCYLPVLYPGSAAHENDQVRLGRMTDWQDLGNGYYRGMGQHLLLLGEEEKGLLELREITFKPSGPAQSGTTETIP